MQPLRNIFSTSSSLLVLVDVFDAKNKHIQDNQHYTTGLLGREFYSAVYSVRYKISFHLDAYHALQTTKHFNHRSRI